MFRVGVHLLVLQLRGFTSQSEKPVTLSVERPIPFGHVSAIQRVKWPYLEEILDTWPDLASASRYTW
jgi:hypothetical protein